VPGRQRRNDGVSGADGPVPCLDDEVDASESDARPRDQGCDGRRYNRCHAAIANRHRTLLHSHRLHVPHPAAAPVEPRVTDSA